MSKYRHSLSDESTRAAVVLGSWTKLPGVVVDSDIIKLFNDKRKRVKAVGSSQTIVMLDAPDKDVVVIDD